MLGFPSLPSFIRSVSASVWISAGRRRCLLRARGRCRSALGSGGGAPLGDAVLLLPAQLESGPAVTGWRLG